MPDDADHGGDDRGHENELVKAVRSATEQLSRLPTTSMEVRALQIVMRGIEEEVASWKMRPPSHDQQQAMKEKLLAIHLAASGLTPRKARGR
jgi:hypothetical protein